MKSPLDFVVPLVRQFDIRDILLTFRKPESKLTTPIAKEINGAAGYVTYTMTNQGLFLLYPPDVGGWIWSDAWLNSTAMTERIGAADLLIGNDKEAKPLTDYFAKKITTDFAPKAQLDVAYALAAIFDANLSDTQRETLAEACQKNGGVAALQTPKAAAKMLGITLRLLFAAPEFHLC